MRQEIETPSGVAWADVERPSGPARALLVLGHGAGGGVDAPDLSAARSAALAAGIVVVRVTQPYRVLGRRAPVPAPRLDEAWMAVVAAVRRGRGLGSLPLVVGGRSSGARVACRTAAAVGAHGVVALAFPLHPPGRPEKSRLDELESVTVPVLVVQGERDPFGVPPDHPDRRLVVIAGADHGLKREPAVIGAAVAGFVLDLVG